MTKTVANTVVSNGQYRIVFNDTEQVYPYSIYFERYDDNNEWQSEKVSCHRELKYCMYRIAEEMTNR